ncbi:MAG TPA: VIT domain-containing protein [Marinagarivorans sp.]
MLNDTFPNQRILLRDTRANLHPIFIAPAYRARTRAPWRRITQLLLSIGVLLGASIGLQQRAVAEPWHAPQTGALMLNEQAGQDGQAQTQPATLLSTDVEATISGLLADVTFSQTFNNASAQTRDGDYYFPLPDNASVYQMTLKIGDRVIQGEIREKREAQKMFEQAKTAGQHAALTQQHRPNIFSQHIANIAPGETIAVTLRYLQPIAYQQGQFEWRLPTTITPRYAPLTPSPEHPVGDDSSDTVPTQPEHD